MKLLLRLSNVYSLYRCLGINLLLVEYRGYGLSCGTPSEEGLGMDAQAAVSYLKTRTDIDQSKIIVFGRSLGGAVAIDVVSKTEISSRVAGLVIENTFTSIPDMAKVLFSNVKVLSSLPVWCHKNKVSKIINYSILYLKEFFLKSELIYNNEILWINFCLCCIPLNFLLTVLIKI